jgi:hypothetical protein
MFPAEADSFYNLYYACHPCNHIKRGKWPSLDLQRKGISFVDLCVDDFEDHFHELDDGRWIGRTLSGQYTIDALRLNRPHLVEIRDLIKQYNLR